MIALNLSPSPILGESEVPEVEEVPYDVELGLVLIEALVTICPLILLYPSLSLNPLSSNWDPLLPEELVLIILPLILTYPGLSLLPLSSYWLKADASLV